MGYGESTSMFDPLLICIYSEFSCVRSKAVWFNKIPVINRISVFVKPEYLRFSLSLDLFKLSLIFSDFRLLQDRVPFQYLII